jgi:hypothetical protein
MVRAHVCIDPADMAINSARLEYLMHSWVYTENTCMFCIILAGLFILFNELLFVLPFLQAGAS